MEENGIPGTVRYYGCPAEEAGGAKTYMARDGLFDDLDAAFNFHPMYANMASKGSMVGVNTLKFHFYGRSAHAGASPHLGRSALDAVELMNVGLNYLREHVTTDVRMHYTITNARRRAQCRPRGSRRPVHDPRAPAGDPARGDQPGAENCRGRRPDDRNPSGRDLRQFPVQHAQQPLPGRSAVCQHAMIGPIHWTEEELEFARKINQGYPPGTDLANAAGYGIPAELLKETLLGENYPALDEGKVFTGSTDVGDLSWKTPVSMLTTACWTLASVGHSWGVVATSGMSIGHKGMMHAAKIMALTAMDLYTNPSTSRKPRPSSNKNSPHTLIPTLYPPTSLHPVLAESGKASRLSATFPHKVV